MSTGHEVDKSSIYRICIKVTLMGETTPTTWLIQKALISRLSSRDDRSEKTDWSPQRLKITL